MHVPCLGVSELPGETIGANPEGTVARFGDREALGQAVGILGLEDAAAIRNA